MTEQAWISAAAVRSVCALAGAPPECEIPDEGAYITLDDRATLWFLKKREGDETLSETLIRESRELLAQTRMAA